MVRAVPAADKRGVLWDFRRLPHVASFRRTRLAERSLDVKPPKATFDEIMNLAVETGVITTHMQFAEYCDASFAPDLETISIAGMPFPRLPDAGPAASGGGAAK